MFQLLIPVAYAGDSSDAATVLGGFVGFGLLIMVGFLVFRRGRTSNTRTPTLVLTGFRINPSATNEPCIDITGRPQGLVAWLLTAMQLRAETRLSVTDLQLSIHAASLFGEFNNFIPLPHVSSTHCGYSKPFTLLVLAIAFLIAGFIGALAAPNGGSGALLVILGLIAAGVCMAFYFLKRKISIEILADSGLSVRMAFKSSVLDGVPVTIAMTVEALNLLNQKVLGAA